LNYSFVVVIVSQIFLKKKLNQLY